MKSYTIYKTSTGQILRSGNCNSNDFNNQSSDNESIIEGIYDDSKYYFLNNTAIQIPARPNDYSYFNFDTKEWVSNVDLLKYRIRSERNKKLSESDWTQLNDVSLSNKSEWLQYRQLLRDITNQQSFPFNVVWPQKPE